MRIRRDLHPEEKANGPPRLPPASFTMTRANKNLFLKVLKDVKVPGGYSSNISRHVQMKDGTISGLKSHDYHILMQQLLPIALRRVLPKDVAQVLIELSSYFRKLCSKSLNQFEFSQLQDQIIKITCHLEKIFPPSFFDIMLHLPIHLSEEARVAGPVFYRWMYTVERYLLTLKLYVRNRAHPEGSIAEGYLVEECLTFCSRYLNEVETKLNRPERNFEGDSGGRALGAGKMVFLDSVEWEQAHRYVLANSSSIDPFRGAHMTQVRAEYPRLHKREIERKHNETFPSWLKEHVQMLGASCSDEVRTLSVGPERWAMKYSGYIVNGLRFHTKHRERRRKTQNSGVMLDASTPSYATATDNRPITGEVTYYGILKKVIELRYSNGLKIVLFKCDWVDNNVGLKRDEFKFTLVNFKHLMYKQNLRSDEPFILASQAQQVWYVKDPIDEDWSVVAQMSPRDIYDVPDKVLSSGSVTCPQTEPFGSQQLNDGPTVWIQADADGIMVDSIVDVDIGDHNDVHGEGNDYLTDSDYEL